MPDHDNLAKLIWQFADLLRGPYQPAEYGRVILPMTVLRRLDCMLAPTKAKVLDEFGQGGPRCESEAMETRLNRAAGQPFHNRSPLEFGSLRGDPDDIGKHLVTYINGFSKNVHEIFESLEFPAEIERMRDANILQLMVSKFADLDLSPDTIPNERMGLVFEDLIRRFGELANETVGDYFTPRDVVRLMVNILFNEDDPPFAAPGTVRRLLDPACGTGGMLAEAQNHYRRLHGAAPLSVHGQDYNARAFAMAAASMLMKREDHDCGGDIRFGDSLTDDRFDGERFDYFLSNLPFGMRWRNWQKEIRQEHRQLGPDGRFGAGLPRMNDSSLLFLQHMWHKREAVQPDSQKRGSRLVTVFSGSPLFVGGAESGESEIRRWLIEEDWLEAVIALPEQMFYNTGIGTYLWVVTNNKEKRRKGRIQLVDARGLWTPGGSAGNRRGLGDKRRHMSEDQIREIVQLFSRFENGERSRIQDNADFGFTRVTVERPLRLCYRMTIEGKARFLEAFPHLLDDVQAIDEALGRDPIRDWNKAWKEISNLLRQRRSRWKAPEKKIFRNVFTQKDSEAVPVPAGRRAGGYEPDPALRDFENVPLKQDVDAYFEREVLPHVPDAWMDRDKEKVGYRIAFNHHFYRHMPPRPLKEIDTELKRAEEEIRQLLREVVE